jgi:hypothetical protein
MGGVCSMHGEMRHAYKILVGSIELKRLQESRRCIWDDNIRMNLEWEVVDWIHVAQNRDQWRALVNTVMNLRVP